MDEYINPRITNSSSEEFDRGFSREEAEDWLNDVPLFQEEPPSESEGEPSGQLPPAKASGL
jgi:hypothetical protein